MEARERVAIDSTEKSAEQTSQQVGDARLAARKAARDAFLKQAGTQSPLAAMEAIKNGR